MRIEIGDLHSRPAEEVIEGAQRMFPRVAFHWTVKNHGMTYGGLHESKEAAQKAKRGIVDLALNDLVAAHLKNQDPTTGHEPEQVRKAEARFLKWHGAEIIYLKKGQDYRPHGSIAPFYKHGKTDGAHGSKIAHEGDAKILALPKLS